MENIKDFILAAPIEEINKGGKEKTAAKSKPSVSFETIFATGTDFAIRKKTPRTSCVLAVIVSQNQFYIKNETAGGTVEILDCENLRKFTAPIPDGGFKVATETGQKATWINKIQRGQEWASGFISALRNVKIVPYMKSGMFLFDDLASKGFTMPNGFPGDFEKEKVVFEAAAAENIDKCILRKAILDKSGGYNRYYMNDWDERHILALKARNLFIGMFEIYRTRYMDDEKLSAYDEICNRWGIEGVRAFVRAFIDTPVCEFPSGELLRDLFHVKDATNEYNGPRTDVTFALQNMVEYMFYEASAQGFADDLRGFIGLWSDYMGAQQAIRGRIDNKYPQNLASEEKILAYRVSQLKRKADEGKWLDAVSVMEQYEWEKDEYMIICPKRQADLVEEGRQMGHCVGNYVNSVANQHCMIFFLRRKSDPDQSLVTIEIREDGSLGQVRAKFNKAPSYEHMSLVEMWHEKMFIKASRTA